MIPQRSKLTPSRSDIGRPVTFVPDGTDGVLVDVHGIFAKFKFRAGPKGKVKTHYASCDVRNLKLIKQQMSKRGR